MERVVLMTVNKMAKMPIILQLLRQVVLQELVEIKDFYNREKKVREIN